MKNTVKKIVLFILGIDIVWRMCKPLLFLVEKLTIYRRLARPSKSIVQEHYSDLEKSIMSLLGDPVVRHNHFKGLRYPSYTSFCSTIFPKILGSYELELKDIIEKQCNTNYNEIIDIGCAEGYYAIGFARRIPTAQVYAYDTNEFARAFCSEMANLNNVRNVKVESFCSPETLEHFKFRGKSLIISDCEGYERVLFNEKNLQNLLDSDLLIETHDFLDATISGYLISLFSKTHHVEIISSVDDTVKSRVYQFPEADRLDIKARRMLFAEGRPGLMEWLYLTPKETR
ncbi:MAG: methyltransferase [Bacteroidetes bacterium]|nr:methyltransferase [Bacteroidota bacterium]